MLTVVIILSIALLFTIVSLLAATSIAIKQDRVVTKLELALQRESEDKRRVTHDRDRIATVSFNQQHTIKSLEMSIELMHKEYERMKASESHPLF